MQPSLSQSLSPQMRMEQRLTPQLIQSMSILQKPVAELEAYINGALETNAALEIAELRQHERTGDGSTDGTAREAQPAEDDFARLLRYARETELDFTDGAPPMARRLSEDGERDAKSAALANTAGREVGLHEYLLDQWMMAEVTPDVRRAGEAIVQGLDHDGYLRVRLDEIAAGLRPPLPDETVEQALYEIQLLDPPGIAARDLVECLLLQLDLLPGNDVIERRLIKDHLQDIALNRLPAIAKATGYSVGEITEALKVIRSNLNPHPGYLISNQPVPIIRPDLIVEYAETGGGLTVRLSRGNSPKLRINPEITALVKSAKNGRDTKDFVRKQVEAAAAIIDAVQFRQSRVLEVGKAIVERQAEFFNIGPEGLKVLRMSDLAEELNCDPSTISRTVADKYMQTPRGIYPLRYFFTGGTETEDGGTMGWDRVKTRVREIVDSENRTEPLNDDQIMEILKREGIVISRRTVAKYRQQLEIPAARQRRVFGSPSDSKAIHTRGSKENGRGKKDYAHKEGLRAMAKYGIIAISP